MKKALLYLVLILVGVAIGYALNSTLEKNEIVNQKPEKVIIEKVKKKIIRDTVRIKKIIEVPKSIDSVFISDTVYLSKNTEEDITNIEEMPQSDTGEVIIIREEMISQRLISLEPSPSDSSDVSEILNLKSSAFSNEIMVEFWKSPMNLTGYELTRNRLKLFGFNPNESISLQLSKNEEHVLLNTESMSIVLHKTKQFKSLKLR